MKALDLVPIDQALDVAVHAIEIAGGASSAFGKLRPFIARVFKRRNQDAPEDTVAVATSYATDFAVRLARQFRNLEDSGSISPEIVERAMANPQFVHMLHSAVITASESPSNATREQLARLVAKRLIVDGETSLAINIRLAIERLRDLNDTHLLLVGLLWFFNEASLPEWLPGKTAPLDQFEPYMSWILDRFRPFDSIREIKMLDNLHLLGAGVMTNDGVAGLCRPLAAGKVCFGEVFSQDARLWQVRQVADYWPTSRPTAVGMVIGASVFDTLTGSATDFSWWNY